MAASWREFYEEVGAALSRCGVTPDEAVLEALAPTAARNPPRHLDFPNIRAERLWALHEALRSERLQIPPSFRPCLKRAVELWELRIDDLGQGSLGVALTIGFAATGMAIAKIVIASSMLLTVAALVPPIVGMGVTVSAIYRLRAKRAVSRLKLMC